MALSPEFIERQGKGRISLLTPELAKTFIETYKATRNVSASADRAGISVATYYVWMAKGRKAKSGPQREFFDGVTRARGDFMALLATRHHQIAVGGIIKKPKRVTLFTENGRPIETSLVERAPAVDENGQIILGPDGKPMPGEIVWEEHWQEADRAAMEWEMDRLDPETYVKQPDVAITNETNVSVATRQEIQARAQVVTEAVKLLADQGVFVRLPNS